MMRARDLAYTTLREEILSGELNAGAVLAEVEQARRLGVSRTPIREALSRLAADGLATQSPGRGTVVSGVSAEDVDQLFELRLPLETQAARLAAQRADRDTFLTLAEKFAQAESGLDAQEHYKLAGLMDEAIDGAVDNSYLTAALTTMRLHLLRARRLSQFKPGRLADSAGEHRRICLAIASGDPELAAAAVTYHLRQSLRYIASAALADSEHTETAKDDVPTTERTAA